MTLNIVISGILWYFIVTVGTCLMILFLMDKFLMREELSHWQVELAT